MAGYLGNKFDMIVHHLAVMKPKCKIYDIKKEIVFTLFQIFLTKQEKKYLFHANTVLIKLLN